MIILMGTIDTPLHTTNIQTYKAFNMTCIILILIYSQVYKICILPHMSKIKNYILKIRLHFLMQFILFSQEGIIYVFQQYAVYILNKAKNPFRLSFKCKMLKFLLLLFLLVTKSKEMRNMSQSGRTNELSAITYQNSTQTAQKI